MRPQSKADAREGKSQSAQVGIDGGKVASTPSVAQQMAKLKRQLLAEHIKELANNPPPEDDEGDERTRPRTIRQGPRRGRTGRRSNAERRKRLRRRAGHGQRRHLQDPEFLLYYKTVQDQIKKAWNFTGGSNDLTATVNFAIGPDGR